MREYHKRGNIALKLGKRKSKIRWFVELSCVCVCKLNDNERSVA